MRITRATRHAARPLTILAMLIVPVILFILHWRTGATDVVTDAGSRFLRVQQNLIPIENPDLKQDLTSNAISGNTGQFLKVLEERISSLERKLSEVNLKLVISQPVSNNYNFSYLHNPVGTCTKSETNVLVAVRSAATHFKKRQTFRTGSIGQYVNDGSNQVKLLFFIGQSSAGKFYKTHKKSIAAEVKDYNDIVQEDFEDVYSNNRFKSISILRWPRTFCPGIKYVIRSDDDIVFNLPELVSTLDRISQQVDNFVVGSKGTSDPVEIMKRKGHSLSAEDYSELPSYLLGRLQGFPMKTNHMLYEAALRVNPLWLEDIAATSVCAKKMLIPVMTDPAFVIQHV